MKKMDGFVDCIKNCDFVKDCKKKEEKSNIVLIVLAIIGAVAAVAGIAFAVYKYMTPDYLDDFDDDFDDDFEDDFFEDEEDSSEEQVDGKKMERVLIQHPFVVQ